MNTGFSTLAACFFGGLLISASSTVAANNVQREIVTYTPPKSGHIVEIPFTSKFINCFGEVHVTISKNSKDIKSSGYTYKGKSYSPQALGVEHFQKVRVGLTDISADVYSGSARLGRIKMENVIDWFGGCFGQTYHAMKRLGLNDADYKDNVESLSLRNITVIEAATQDDSLEEKIRGLEKKNLAQQKIQEADKKLAAGQLKQAQNLLEEARRLDPAVAQQVQAKLADIKKRIAQERKDQTFRQHLADGRSAFSKGAYKSAKSSYEKALAIYPEDHKARQKLEEIIKRLQTEQKAIAARRTATGNAKNRRHQGFFWATNHEPKSPGSMTQETVLLGNYRIDYDLKVLMGEPVQRFRFYWEWADALDTGYPLWTSIRKDTSLRIAELARYPELLHRWNQIKPEYVEIDAKINSYQNDARFVADSGTMTVIPEVIGRSGQEVGWSAPASPNWDELFPHVGIEFSYFQAAGVYDSLTKYANDHGTEIAWPKFAFEHSDTIDFSLVTKHLKSQYRKFEQSDRDSYSVSAEITKVIWPVNKIAAILDEFENLEKRRKKEDAMSAQDFWNTPENSEESQADFWNVSENTKTVADIKQRSINAGDKSAIGNHSRALNQWLKKYASLRSPLSINSPTDGNELTTPEVELNGSLSKYLVTRSNAAAYLLRNGVREALNVDRWGRFSQTVELSEGKNDFTVVLRGDGFALRRSVSVDYKEPEPEPEPPRRFCTGSCCPFCLTAD